MPRTGRRDSVHRFPHRRGRTHRASARVSQTLSQPYFPGVGGNAAAADGSVLDPNLRPNHSDEFNFTIQRSFSSKLIMEVGYIGRKIANEFQVINLDAVPYMTTLGGQSFATAPMPPCTSSLRKART